MPRSHNGTVASRSRTSASSSSARGQNHPSRVQTVPCPHSRAVGDNVLRPSVVPLRIVECVIVCVRCAVLIARLDRVKTGGADNDQGDRVVNLPRYHRTAPESVRCSLRDRGDSACVSCEMTENSRIVKDGVAPVIVKGSAANGHHHSQLNGGHVALGKDGRKVIAPLLEADAHAIHEPPDGGTRAWLVMVGAFLCNGVLFGVINTYSVVYLSLQKQLQQSGDSEASSKAALVGSLTIGTTFLLSPVSGILTDKIGLRRTTFIGGLLTCSGMFLSSFVTHSVVALYFTYGIMFGLGAALAYTPSLAILGHYFKRYLGLVNGIVTAGSSVFTAIMPVCLNYLVEHTSLATSFRILAIISSFVIFCSLLYKPLQPPPPPPNVKPGRSAVNNFLRSFINFDNWKKRRYIIWAVSIPIALFGYFVPYVHMGKFVQDNFPGKGENLPVMCIGITSGLGRLIFGFIADLPRVNRVLLQQMSFVLIGTLTMCLPATGSFPLLLAIALAMGLFDGCFISLLGPIAYDICGPRGATQAIGFLLGMCSLPLTLGPPVAGMLYDQTGSYKLPFILAGIPPLFGASTMFLIRCVRDEDSKQQVAGTEPKQEPLAHAAWDCENPTDGKPLNGLHHERRATLASSESLTAEKNETG